MEGINELKRAFKQEKNKKLTENRDSAYANVGDVLLDVFFKTQYYRENIDELYEIDELKHVDKDTLILFAMFIRDPRKGLGERDVGRALLDIAEATPEQVVAAGRYDDLFNMSVMKDEHITYFLDKLLEGDKLAKKWAPRISGKDKSKARYFAKKLGLYDISTSHKGYRELIKLDTFEHKLTYHEVDSRGRVIHPKRSSIVFSEEPSLVPYAHRTAILRDDELREKWEDFIDDVDAGKHVLKSTTTSPYDVYRAALSNDGPDIDTMFESLKKISVDMLPILDTSSSMYDSSDSFGKACSLAVYLSRMSTYAQDFVVSFSSKPALIDLNVDKIEELRGGYWGVPFPHSKSNYTKRVSNAFTGDVCNTDFGAVMRLLSTMNKFPEYLVVLSDMEFDYGSSQSKDEAMRIIREYSPHTKIVWWNFYSDNNAVPETDDYGNVFISGYNPTLLTYLETGFDGKEFLNKLLAEYKKSMYGII